MKKLAFNMLVMPYENGYMALCKETGIIRGGATLEEARGALLSANKVLIEAVSGDKRLAPSLAVGLPLRYRALFYWTILKILTGLGTRATIEQYLYQTEPFNTFHSKFSPA